jgi:hypothetical protein
LAAGWSAKKDDEYTEGELAEAAAMYVEAAHSLIMGADVEGVRSTHTSVSELGDQDCIGQIWPLLGDINIEADPIRNLAKAGALIAAEIDRLARQSVTAF